MEIAQIVTLSLNILFALFILLGFLWGMKRGLKKSAYRILFVFVGLLIAFFASSPIALSLMNMDISSIVTLSVEDQTYKNLSDYIQALLMSNPDIADIMANSEALKELIIQLPTIIIQSIIFVILFWILKMITWPIWATVTKNAYKQKHENLPAPKKRRMLGGLVGVAQGLLIMFVTLLPISGVVGLVKELDKGAVNSASASTTSIENQEQPKTLLKFLLQEISSDETEIDQYLEIIKSYDSSILGSVNNATGLDLAVFDALTTAKVDGRAIVPRQELAMVNKVYQSYVEIQKIDTENLNGTLDLDAIEKLINTIFNSDLLGVVADDLMPYFIEKTIDEQQETMDPIVHTFLTSYLDTYGTPAFNTLKNDCLVLVKTAKAIQSHNLFLLANDSNITAEKVFGMLQRTATDDPIGDIFTELLKSNTLKNLLTESVNLALSYLDKTLTTFAGQEIEIQKVVLSNVDWETEQNNIINLLNNIVDMGYNIAPHLQDTKIEYSNIIKTIEFKNIGSLIDTFANSQLFADAYDNTCDALNSIEKTSQYINFATLKNDIVWEDEFTHIDNIKNILNTTGVLDILLKSSISNNDITLCLQLLDAKPKLSNDKYITSIANEIMACELLKSSTPRIMNTLNDKLGKQLKVEVDSINETLIDWTNEENHLNNILEGISSNHELVEAIITEEISIKNFFAIVNIAKLKNVIVGAQSSQLFGNTFNATIEYVKQQSSIKEIVNLDFITRDFNWDAELTKFESIIESIQATDFIEQITSVKGEEAKSLFNYINNNKEFTANIITALYETEIFKNNLQSYINKIEDEFATALNVTITKTTIDLNVLNQNIAQRKTQFADALINTSWIIPYLLDGATFDLDFVTSHITEIGTTLDSIQNCYEFTNIYNALLDYLKTNEEINNVIDFTVVGTDFNWVNEMQTLSEIVDILKANNVWDSFIADSSTIDTIVESLAKEVQQEILVKLSQSAFFSQELIKVVNEMLEMAGDYLGTTLTPISDTTDLSNQTDNIVDISNDLLAISQSGTNLEDIDLDLIASLLDNLKYNKFEITNGGVFSELYNKFVEWLIDPNNNEYASNIETATRTFDNTAINVWDIEEVDWKKVISLLAINILIEEVSTFTGEGIDIIPYTTDISNQKENIEAVVNKALEVFTNGSFDIDTVDRIKVAELLELLKDNKFSTTYLGLLAPTYNALVTYLVELEEYGEIFDNAIKCYDNTKINAYEVQNVDWQQVMYLFPYDVIINTVSELTGEVLEKINYNQQINDAQKISLDKIYEQMKTLIPDANVNLEDLDKAELGKLLTLLKEHKFSVEYNGIMSSTYNAIVKWMTSDTDTGYLFEKIIRTYDTATPATQNVYDINTVDWNSILDAIQYLDSIKSQFENLTTLSTAEMKSLMQGISNKALYNNDIVELIEIFLTHNETNQDKINAVNNFDFKDYNTFATVIDSLTLFNDAINNINTNKVNALNSIKIALDNLDTVETIKLNNTITFLDCYANMNISEKMTNVDFETESNLIATMLELLDAPTYNNETLKNLLSQLSNSTLILNEMDANNIVLFDTNDPVIIDALRNAIAEENNIPDPSLVSDELVILGIKALINEVDTTEATKIKIAKLFNINLL